MTTVIVLSGTFSVIGISFLIHQNLTKVLTQWGNSISMSVFLDDEFNNSDKLISKIKKSEGVASFEYVSKEKASQLFKDQVESYIPDLVFDSEFKNPLPASYEIKFDRNWSKEKYNEVVRFAKELMDFKGVEEVSYGQNWVENYAAVVDKFNHSSGLLIFVLLTGSLFVVGNSIRNSISQRRDEIEILELIGSTKWSIRIPYIFEGFVLGFIASLISIIVTYLVFNWQLSVIESGVGIVGGQYHLSFLSFKTQFIIVLLGSIFGVVGAYFCVTKLSTGWTAHQAES
ncbi:MAG: FtsX-like permease family protein [Bdellovibrionaceae bacterium]|nr:FtsX-like permease family protein [Pseudobdellovibrionaceae bacterium]